jgi:outer membrane immunogenic protein
MKYKGFLLATAGGLAMAPGAQAADLQVKAPTMVPPPANWTGWYIGGNLGAVWQQGHAAGQGYRQSLSYTSSSNFVGGGQIGYNWQHGNFVLGLEADGSWLGGGGSVSGSIEGAVKGSAGVLTQSIKWLSTVRARTGLVVGDTMAYVTGGVAFGKVDNTLNSGCPQCLPNIKSESGTRVGWAFGGGIEHMWDQHWTIGLEGLFVDLGGKSAFAPTSIPNSTKTTKFSNSALLGRFKVNYKF